MTYAIDETHDARLTSWVGSANGHPDFPIQNLPLCVFSLPGDAARRGGILIGESILDLRSVLAAGIPGTDEAKLLETASGENLNAFFKLSAPERGDFRRLASGLLSADQSRADALRASLVDASAAVFHLPVEIGDYTDFFAGIHHAVNAGRMFRPDNPLLPNYRHVPIAYHGRSSSIRASGHPVPRPVGQTAAHGATHPSFGPSKRLDFELEMAIWVRGENPIGETIPVARAGDEIVGFGLLNDWSARDIQAWETQPLGPFLGKNFLTSVSPLVVTAEALAPFRYAQEPRADDDPAPLEYLIDDGDQQNGAFGITFEVSLLTPAMREAGHAPLQLTRTSGRDLYWTPAQMVAHHASNGCNLRAGDLFGSGTISGPGEHGHGSLLEMTAGGREPITFPGGETRTFLENGDEVTLSGWCERDGFARIGLGSVTGTVVG